MKQATQPTQATSASTPPLPGQFWPEQNGHYAGIVLSDARAIGWHLIVPSAPEFSFAEVIWGKRGQSVIGAMSRYDGYANTLAMAEAGSEMALQIRALPGDCYLPSRGETALCFATLADQFETDDCYWTSTQYSDITAFDQTFDNGYQDDSIKSHEGRARAVRRLAI